MFGNYKALQNNQTEKEHLLCARKLYFPTLHKNPVKWYYLHLQLGNESFSHRCLDNCLSERAGLRPQEELITKLAKTASQQPKN